MHAMPLLLGVLCVFAIAYRYYSAFVAAKVAALDDSRVTPAHRFDDGQNFHPTSKWVLFGHHFAAISGAGPLIGPVLAAQFGFLPGLLWIVVGVCLAGAVQDFLALAASVRRDGKSLAQIAFTDVGRASGTAATIAIVLILVVALAGLGKVVVKALGGETVKFAPGTELHVTQKIGAFAADTSLLEEAGSGAYRIPAGSEITTAGITTRTDSPFILKSQEKFTSAAVMFDWPSTPTSTQPATTQDSSGIFIVTPTMSQSPRPTTKAGDDEFPNFGVGVGAMQSIRVKLPPDAARVIPGSSWGVFTIAATIPIALLVGLWMYKVRPGKTVEASVIGGLLTLGATVLGASVKDSAIADWFDLSQVQVTWAMAAYGFVAAVLPVWVLLAPRDYLSSFLKIGTIGLLVFGVLIANPKLQAPAVNHAFLHGGPVLGPTASIFPFLFTTIMCGAISGFHALVGSGTTSKMLTRETQARTIGYGAMLVEGLVGVVALIAAASLGPADYYAMNTDLAAAPQWQDRITQIGGAGGIEHISEYEALAQEPLRGRTGGAVTLAVGIAHIFDNAAASISQSAADVFHKLWPYWYHFAVMFEALFILTTIDAGTRIGRFLLQEIAGKISPRLGRKDWWPGAVVSTGLIVAGWAWFMNSDNFAAVWRMFGIANQTLAVIALAVLSCWLVNSGRRRYLAVTLVPMVFVATTTGSAAVVQGEVLVSTIRQQWGNASPNHTILVNAYVQAAAIGLMIGCATIVLLGCAWRVGRGITRVTGHAPDARDEARPPSPFVADGPELSI